MTDKRTPEEIERKIEAERAGLSNTLENLQERLSVDGFIRQVGEQFREHGGDIGASVSRSAKDNPIALALTGIGLAWMIFGGKAASDQNRDLPRSTTRTDARPVGYQTEPSQRTGGVGYSSENYGNRSDDSPNTGRPDMMRTPAWARDRGSDRNIPYDASGHDDTGRTMKDRASAATGKLSSKTSDLRQGLSDTKSKASASISNAAGRASEMTGDTVDHTRERFSSLHARLSEGTESLSAEARHRVMAARRRALEARDAAADYARDGREKATDIFEQHPLIAGAMAVAVGAAIGAALPRTRVEDEYLGQQSDDLVAEAERIFDAEREKIGKVANAAVGEVKTMMGEAQDRVRETFDDTQNDPNKSGDTAKAAAEKANDAGQRIANAAKSEADKQGLTSFDN